jgi:trehalose synthase
VIAVPPPGPALDEYVPLLAEDIEEMRLMVRTLEKREVLMVNSTAVGGGVAEILNRVIPLLEQLGMRPRWEILEGSPQFFEVTKAFHNALHGAPFHAGGDAFDLFRQVTELNRQKLNLDSEFAVMHDPQPAGLIDARKDKLNHWIWRCHIDLSRPNQAVWEFLEPWVNRYDAAIFSSPAFARQLPVSQYLFYPSIDPLSEKNRLVEPDFIQQVLERFGIDPRRPIIVQVSRFDRLKDPVGVVRAYRMARRYSDCQLVLAGGGASDDPEGRSVLEETREEAGADPDIHILELSPTSHLEINALQRAATIVLQKSLREGFGLTVTEALWKKKPVIASAVGGIPSQVIHKQTGMLAHSIEGTAYQIRYLLGHPQIAERLGENGHQHVRENFLITGNIKRYLTLFLYLMSQPASRS